MENGIIVDIDPVLITIGELQVGYYGLIFMLTFWASLFTWRHYMKRAGHPDRLIGAYLPWFFGSFLVGVRLGHCFFYEPARYMADPVSILFFWKGGLSSHGATIGLLLGLFLYARVYRLSSIDIVDRFSPCAAIGAAAVRLGNFFNSEIVGRATDLPWAMRFVRYRDGGEFARHPTQLYESCLGMAVLAALIFADRKAGKERRPPGLITGLFGVAYFGGRFFIEFTKEHQGVDDGWPITIGQVLCIPFMLIGAGLIARAKKTSQKNNNKTNTHYSF